MFSCVLCNRCLDPSLNYPNENPIYCHARVKLNDSFAIQCCNSGDNCNKDQRPLLHTRKPPGRRQLFYLTLCHPHIGGTCSISARPETHKKPFFQRVLFLDQKKNDVLRVLTFASVPTETFILAPFVPSLGLQLLHSRLNMRLCCFCSR